MQLDLFSGPLGFDPVFSRAQRIWLDEDAWVERVSGWVSGHRQLFDCLLANTSWQHQQRKMYDRVVDVPRLVASLPRDGPGHPLVAHMASALSRRYGVLLERVTLALYRNGQDSVAWHGDKLGELRDNTVVAIAAVGGSRRFMMRPVGSGRSLTFQSGRGDLLVMGGNCQKVWQHCVPKRAHAEPRISIMFRQAIPTPPSTT